VLKHELSLEESTVESLMRLRAKSKPPKELKDFRRGLTATEFGDVERGLEALDSVKAIKIIESGA
jgi:hypothetical protein